MKMQINPNQLVDAAEQILALGLLMTAAHFGGKMSRKIGVGEIVGQIFGGILVGPQLTSMIGISTSLYEKAFGTFHFFTFLFLSLIAFSLGEELHFKKFALVGRKAMGICFVQGLATWVIISAVFRLMGFSTINSLIIGSIGIATAPATIFVLMNKLTIEGKFRELLANIVVLADVAEIFLFAVLIQIAQSNGTQSVPGTANGSWLGPLIIQMSTAIAMGFALFVALKLIIRFKELPAEDPLGTREMKVRNESGLEFISLIFQEHPQVSTDLMIVILALLSISVGISFLYNLPFLLVALIGGIGISNFHSHILFKSLQIDPITRVMNLIFFGLIGASVDLGGFNLDSLKYILAYVVARTISKIVGTWLGARFWVKDPKIISCLPRMLLPQGGVALVEVSYLAMILGAEGQKIFSILLPAIVIFEIGGIIVSENTLKKWKAWTVGEKEALEGDMTLDEPLQLSDLIDVSRIRLDLKVSDKEVLFRLLAKTFAIKGDMVYTDGLFNEVMEREKLLSTAIGFGVALPHCRYGEALSPQIALATIPAGMDFGAHDGYPVKIAIMLVSPEEPPESHLKALALVSRLLMKPDNRNLILELNDPLVLHEKLVNMDLMI
jgi:mannitol/fructose-specific phosphotransferase system IIA component (Ntr-type)